MKKTFKTLLVMCLFLSAILLQDGFAAGKTDSDKTRIVIVNPDLDYVQSFVFLVENGIINIPELEFVGIIYEKSNHKYDEIKKYLGENRYPYFKIEKVNGSLKPGTLYKRNSCSNEFLRLFNESDGILFLGGPDIPSVTYESKTNLLTRITDPHRHYFELSFLFHLLGGSQNQSFPPFLEENKDYVVNAFCLGMQTMNVATGGTLYQDIPSEIYGLIYVEDLFDLDPDKQHRGYNGNLHPDNEMIWCNFHRIRLKKEMFLVKEMGLDADEFPYVLSSHHQAIKEVGRGLKIAAESMDGQIVEALEHIEYENVFGVQFHPEFRELYDPNSERVRININDENMFTLNDILIEKSAVQFHRKYWEYFGSLFQ